MLRADIRRYVSDSEVCLLVDDFYRKAVSSKQGELTFAKWLDTLSTVDLFTLDRLFLELTFPPLLMGPGMLEVFGAGSKSAAALLIIGVALEKPEVNSQSQITPYALRAAMNATAFVKVAFLAKTGVDVSLKSQDARLTTTMKPMEVMSGPFAEERNIPRKAKEYSEQERGVRDEAFQELMRKVTGGKA